jgi:hypothetical protein
MPRKKKLSKRCRKCGHQYAHGMTHATSHARLGKIGVTQKLAHAVCTVDPSDYKEGFPLKEGASFPWRRG